MEQDSPYVDRALPDGRLVSASRSQGTSTVVSRRLNADGVVVWIDASCCCVNSLTHGCQFVDLRSRGVYVVIARVVLSVVNRVLQRGLEQAQSLILRLEED